MLNHQKTPSTLFSPSFTKSQDTERSPWAERFQTFWCFFPLQRWQGHSVWAVVSERWRRRYYNCLKCFAYSDKLQEKIPWSQGFAGWTVNQLFFIQIFSKSTTKTMIICKSRHRSVCTQSTLAGPGGTRCFLRQLTSFSLNSNSFFLLLLFCFQMLIWTFWNFDIDTKHVYKYQILAI